MPDLEPNDYFGYCLRMTSPANFTRPPAFPRADIGVLYDNVGAVADTDLKYRFGADANPANEVDPYGGAIDTATDQNPATAGNLIYAVRLSNSDLVYRGAAYRENKHATDDFVNCRVANFAGGEKPASSGPLEVYSTNAADTENLYLQFNSSAANHSEEVTMLGTTHTFSAEDIDSGSHFIAVYDNGAIPVGDIYGKVGGNIVFVIYGSLSGLGNYCASTFYEVALATAQNATVSGADRGTDPTGCGSFSTATYWPGNDSSIAIPA